MSRTFLTHVLSLLLMGQLTAQPGSLDLGFDPGSGADQPPLASAIQPDGKIIIGGMFENYDGTPRSRIARLNVDGSLDVSFDPGIGADHQVLTITVQPDGKILIGGRFNNFDGTARNHIARLNPDGSLDTGFDPGNGADNWVRHVTLQPDGKILVAGDFTDFDGTPRDRIARLNPDGSLDASFDPGVVANGGILTTMLQPDGKIIISGSFSSIDGITHNNIARLNSDGSLDVSFVSGTGTSAYVNYTTLQPDGKILVGGNFNSYNGTSCNYIIRLNTDGSLDSSFDSGTGPEDWVFHILVQPDDKIIIMGDFGSYDGTPRHQIARLMADGSLDTSFDPGAGPYYGSVMCSTLQPDGKVIIGGIFTNYDGIQRNRIARFETGISAGVWSDHDDNGALNEVLARGEMVTVELFDLFGKKVASRTIVPKGNLLRTVRAVNDQLAAGTYVVGIDAGDLTFTERLVIE